MNYPSNLCRTAWLLTNLASDTLLDDRVDPMAVVQSSRVFSLRYRLGLGKEAIEFAEGARGAVEAQEAEPKRLQFHCW